MNHASMPVPSREVVPRFSVNVLREIVSRDREAGGLLAVDVNGVGSRWVLSALGRFVGEYQPLYCVDGCNQFDPYCLANCARRRGEDPQRVLENVYVSRVFTCHQLAALAREELPRVAETVPRPVVAVLGVADLFYDDALPFWEREHLYRKTLDSLQRIRKRGLPLVVTFREIPGGSGARLWRWLLWRAADRVARVEQLPGDGKTGIEWRPGATSRCRISL